MGTLLITALLLVGTAQADCLAVAGDITADGVTRVSDVQCGILATLSGLSDSPAPACLSGDLEIADVAWLW